MSASLAGSPGPSLLPEKTDFGIGGGAISRCLVGLLALFSLFLVNILSRSQFLLSLTISMQIWTHYKTHIFKKWGYIPQTPPWLRQCAVFSSKRIVMTLTCITLLWNIITTVHQSVNTYIHIYIS